MTESIKPSSSTELQHALSKLTSAELAQLFDLNEIARTRRPVDCPPEWLPWLAWENSIGSDEGWDIAETEAARRRIVAEYIKRAHSLRAKKGRLSPPDVWSDLSQACHAVLSRWKALAGHCPLSGEESLKGSSPELARTFSSAAFHQSFTR